MNMRSFARCWGIFALILSARTAAYGQARVTASQALELSAFGAATGTFTGFQHSRNAAITAGVDLAFYPFFGVRPALEIRGTYPVDSGQVIGEQSGLAGIRLMKSYRRFNPYIDTLFGRGEIKYVNGLVVGSLRYQRTTSNVATFGGGVDFNLTPHFAIKGDVQLERWDIPVSSSGTIDSTSVSLGISYRFNFNH